MIIHCTGGNTPAEYELLLLDLSSLRPQSCAACGIRIPMWIHGSYRRTVIEDSVSIKIQIFRFKCSAVECAKVVTCLPPFLIPYRRYSASVMAAAIQGYGTTKSSYLEQAEAVSGIDVSGAVRPSSAQVFRWVESMTSRIEILLFRTQREIVMRYGLVPPDSTTSGPNSAAAVHFEKKKKLDRLTEFLNMAGTIVADHDNLLFKLRQYFLHKAESVTEIFSVRWLPTPHNMQPQLF